MSVWIVTYDKSASSPGGGYSDTGYMLVFAKTSIGARKFARKRAHEARQEADNFEAHELDPNEHAGRAFEDLVGAWAAAKATRERLAETSRQAGRT